MPPKEKFVYNVKAIMDDGTEVALTELEGITLAEMEEILEIYECVRVVRCGDCAKKDDTQWCEYIGRYVDPDGFCSQGKRRWK